MLRLWNELYWNEKGQQIQTDRIVPHVEEIELKE